MSNWWKVLRKIDDQTLVKLNGIDYTMYIIFIRFASVLTICLAIFSAVFLLPFYMTGDMDMDAGFTTASNTPYVEDALDHFTVLNITASPGSWKLQTTFILAVLVGPWVAFWLLYKYYLKYKSIAMEDEITDNYFDDKDIAKHSVMVRHLPENMAVHDL
jgi:hypothetical protein